MPLSNDFFFENIPTCSTTSLRNLLWLVLRRLSSTPVLRSSQGMCSFIHLLEKTRKGLAAFFVLESNQENLERTIITEIVSRFAEEVHRRSLVESMVRSTIDARTEVFFSVYVWLIVVEVILTLRRWVIYESVVSINDRSISISSKSSLLLLFERRRSVSFDYKDLHCGSLLDLVGTEFHVESSCSVVVQRRCSSMSRWISRWQI